MKFIHKVSMRMTAEQREALEGLGARVPEGTKGPWSTLPLVAFTVSEDDAKWEQITALLESWGAHRHFETTTFSKQEIEKASWLELGVKAHTGYPQPDPENDGYMAVTYDMSAACPKCYIGRRQKAAFRMRGEPAWGKKGLLQMNWLFDEFFVPPAVYEEVFAPFGIASRAVESSSGRPLRTVLQLVVDELADVNMADCDSWTCPECGRTVYWPTTRGPFPSLTGEPTGAMVHTRQFFSGGGWAYPRVLVRADLARAMRNADLRTATYWPVAQEGGCLSEPAGKAL